MNEVSSGDGQDGLAKPIGAARGLSPMAFGFGLQLIVGACLVAGLLLFYGYYYSVHQDLAGSALSGRLAITLGDSFRDYSIYFPPAEKAWFSLAARLADLTGLRLDLTVVVMTGAAVLFACGLAYRIRRETVGASPLFFLLPLGVLVVLPVLFKNVFGLREHMVALGLWPYLVLRVSDPDAMRVGSRTRLVLGAWMGAMLLFKYLYAFVVLLVEVADALVQRRPALLFRIENLAAGAVVALYLVFWLGIDPAQRSAIAAVASAIDANLADATANGLQAAYNLIPAIFFVVAFRIFRLPWRFIALGLAMVLGSIAVAWVQQRWYSHHLFGITMAYVGWWWMAGRGFKWWGHLVVFILLIGSVVREYRNTASYQQSVEELGRALSEGKQSVAGKRIGILTMHPSPYNQYLASHGALRWNASMNNSYVASELKPFDRAENAKVPPPRVTLDEPGRRMLHDEMLRLWEDMPPDVLILDHSTRWPLRYVDVRWRHVFSEDPRFNAILARYRPVLRYDGKKVEFEYLVREN